LKSVLTGAARAEAVDLRCVGASELSPAVRDTSPSLVIIDRELSANDASTLVRKARNGMSEGEESVGVVVVSTKEDTECQQREHDAGANDWLLAPLSLEYARARMRAWLHRTHCRWVRPKRPADEDRRMRALRGLHILDTQPEERFDRHTRIAAALFGVPIALVSLVDTDRQWFKSRLGLDESETSRDAAFCAHAIVQSEVMHVPDALNDDRFADNPLVTGEPHVRFYAGVPLTLADASVVGTLCLIDHRPRYLSPEKIRLLVDLGKLVERELEAGRSADHEQ
jgi:CheY-like chemotaxis protein